VERDVDHEHGGHRGGAEPSLPPPAGPGRKRWFPGAPGPGTVSRSSDSRAQLTHRDGWSEKRWADFPTQKEAGPGPVYHN
jgi:hypothetical protein